MVHRYGPHAPEGAEDAPQPRAAAYPARVEGYPGYVHNPLGAARDDGFALRDLLMILRRRRGLIATSIVFGTALSALVAFQRPVTYTAASMVLIEPDRQILDLDAVVAGVDPTNAAISTQIALIESPSFLSTIAERLYGHRLASAEPLEPETGLWHGLKGLLPANVVSAAGLDDGAALMPETERYEANRQLLAGRIADNLRVSQEGTSSVIRVAYVSENPAEAARVANSLATLYIEEQTEIRRAATGRAGEYLEERLEELEDEVRRAEAQVEEYLRTNRLTAGGVDVSGQQALNLTNMLIERRAERQERETRIAYLRELQASGRGLENTSEFLDSPYIADLWRQEADLRRQEADLRQTYGARHPSVQNVVAERAEITARIRDEAGRVVANLENELRVIREAEASLQAEIDALTDQVGEAGQAEIELRRLEREAEAARNIYENFLQRYKEVREQQDVVEANARVVAPALTPTSPSSLSPKLLTIAGFLGASVMGLFLAFVREHLDKSLRSGKEIEQTFGIPCLGLVPHLPKRTRKGRPPHEYLVQKPLSSYAETVRSLYTSLRLTHLDRPPQVIQVTSSVPAEGKTTLSVSLMAALALDGKKVLLIDTDMRHPSVRREFVADRKSRRQPCLVDHLAEKCDLEDAMTRYRFKDCAFDVLGVKRTPPNPGRLLASERMRALMERFRQEYDYIVLDSTPVLGVSDSKVAMELADTTVFVVQWEKTTLDLASDAIKELRECGANIGGTVITQVDVTKQARYGYGGIDAYYSKYKKYYVD